MTILAHTCGSASSKSLSVPLLLALSATDCCLVSVSVPCIPESSAVGAASARAAATTAFSSCVLCVPRGLRIDQIVVGEHVPNALGIPTDGTVWCILYPISVCPLSASGSRSTSALAY